MLQSVLKWHVVIQTKPLTLGNECCPGQGRSYVRMHDTGPSRAPFGPRPPRPLAQPQRTRTVPGLRVGGIEAIADGQPSSEQGRSGCMEEKKRKHDENVYASGPWPALHSFCVPTGLQSWVGRPPCTEGPRGQLPGSSVQALHLSISSSQSLCPAPMILRCGSQWLPTQHYFSSYGQHSCRSSSAAVILLDGRNRLAHPCTRPHPQVENHFPAKHF